MSAGASVVGEPYVRKHVRQAALRLVQRSVHPWHTSQRDVAGRRLHLPVVIKVLRAVKSTVRAHSGLER